MFLSRKKSLKLRMIGDPVLAAKAKPVLEINEEIRLLSAEMIDLMHRSHGIGLAGNQVGLPLQIVVIDIDAPEDEEGNPIPPQTPGEVLLLPKMPLTLINPQIVSYSQVLCNFNEGCLSVPKIYANVVRPQMVTLKSQLLDGSFIEVECGGLLARVLQHELDHLQGVVFVQKVADPEFGKIEPDVNKIIRKSGQKNFKVRRLLSE